jgi:putative ABC transport system ATP-binding protein
MKGPFKKKNIQKVKDLYQNKPVISESDEIVKRYVQEGSITAALSKVSSVIREGEVVAIVGPSGCGKTTLLNCLSGIDDVDAGDVYFKEENLHKIDDNQKTTIRAKEMGFIFQNFNLIPVLSAVENVELPMLSIGGKSSEARAKALKILSQVGLETKANNKPNELSGGEKQRVAIARSLINDPKIIWADEPTGNLDTANAESIVQLLLELNRTNGVTIVIVTHDSNIAMKAHRVIRMDSGKVV